MVHRQAKDARATLSHGAQTQTCCVQKMSTCEQEKLRVETRTRERTESSVSTFVIPPSIHICSSSRDYNIFPGPHYYKNSWLAVLIHCCAEIYCSRWTDTLYCRYDILSFFSYQAICNVVYCVIGCHPCNFVYFPF